MARFVIKPILPKEMNVKQAGDKLLQSLKDEGQAIKGDLEQTTSSWSGAKPTFKPRVFRSGQTASVIVNIQGNAEGVKKWGILNDGSPPHTIRARRSPTLRFRQGGFKSKTKPGSLKSRGGAKATGPYRSPKSVSHPGSKPRNWKKLATDKSRKRYNKNGPRAIADGANALY